jgi:hypothetical protein
MAEASQKQPATKTFIGFHKEMNVFGSLCLNPRAWAYGKGWP